MLRDKLIRRAAELGIPLGVGVELLSRCNLRCGHCYISRTRRTALSRLQLSALFCELAANGCLYLTLTGGEIGLRKDLFSIIAEARRYRFAIMLISSGTLWGAREWDRIAKVGVARVRLSLYATNPAVHDKVTGVRGSHARTMATLRGLQERGVALEIACAITKRNFAEVGAVAALARHLRVRLIIDPLITWADDGEATPAKLRVSSDNLVAVLHDCLPPSSHEARRRRRRPRPDSRPCRVGEVGGFVRSNGDVVPCVNWPEVAGNLAEASFMELFRDSRVFDRCRRLRFADLSACVNCGYASSCRVCPAMNLQEHGNLATPSKISCAFAAAGTRSPPSSPRRHHGE